MTKKRKLNSKNPIYNKGINSNEKEVAKRVHMCDATIRDSQMRDTGSKAAVYAVWFK
tara:strand:+ start:1133 stop:1303 length:171 start_codon:yes stop_codon:yes gene_type:complete